MPRHQQGPVTPSAPAPTTDGTPARSVRIATRALRRSSVTNAVLPFDSAAAITPALLEQVLRGSGRMREGTVADVRVSPVGTGQMAESVRLTISYDGTSDGPSSLVAKFPSHDPSSRSTGRIMRAYEAEVGFYNDLAVTVEVRTPTCHLAAIDLDTHDFVLLLDDLAPATQGDQLVGCDPDLATRVLDQAAAFHAPRWNDPTLETVGWLDRATPESSAATSAIVASLFSGFVERYGDAFDGEVLRALDRAASAIGTWWQGAGGARTIVHGDLRLDNLLIGDGPDELWVVDWQTTILGNGVADAAYFIGGNLLPDVRRHHEEALMRHHFDALLDRGVRDLGWDEYRRLYRHGSWHGVYMAVGASMLVAQTERGDRMFTTDLIRHIHHSIDLDAFDALEGSHE